MKRLLPLIFAVSGCSAAALDLAGAEKTAFDSGAPAFSLRVDVLPNGDSDLLPQTWYIADPSGGLSLDLAPTVEIRGDVRGYGIAPAATVPGEADLPVVADLVARIDDKLDGAAGVSAEDGSFALQVPAGSGYTLSVVPRTPALLPALIEEDLSLSADQDRQIAIDAGVPVYGQLSLSDGAALPDGTLVRLVHAATGVEGPASEVTATGRYLLRALPGEYLLTVEGDRTSATPRLQSPLTVEPDADAVRQDLSLGELDVVFVDGRVFSEDGDDVDVAELRFTALELVGPTIEGTAAHLTTTNNEGQFRRGLVRGRWAVELIPPADDDSGAGPLRLELDLRDGGASLGDLMLPSLRRVESQVIDVDGKGAAAAVVTFTERGFDGRSYTATTDDDGRFSLQVPDVPLDLNLVPATPTAALTRFVVDSLDELPRLQLEGGQLVTGSLTDDGAPLPFALVEVRDLDGALLARGFADADGRFEVLVRAAPEGVADADR